jgi:predicted secreted hydrolase
MMRGWLALLLLATALPAGAQEFREADRPWEWQFPRDHGSHPEFQTEWWYFTGALRGESGREFGYELTFFRLALALESPAGASAWRTRDLILAHFAVTDLERERFGLVEDMQRAAAGLAGADADSLHIWKGDWSVRQEGRRFVLSAGSNDTQRIALRLLPTRGPILHGDDGLSWKRSDRSHASYYYSMPRMQTHGTLTLDGEPIAVEGTTWMDHEFFTGDTPVEGLGWDWFSCRLQDGRDLMLYLLRYPDGTRYRSGTLVEADGSSRPLDLNSLTLEPLRHWSSPRTGARYPVEWRISIPEEDLELHVQARLDAQEVHAEETVGFAYWEGLSRFTGTSDGLPIQGEGYVELTGYTQEGH